MTPEQLAEIAYEAWLTETCRWRGGLKSWEQLGPSERHSWIAAASAVKANVLGAMTWVNET